MRYFKTAQLKNGMTLTLKSAAAGDGKAVLDMFIKAREESDFLLSYPDEVDFDEQQESRYLKQVEESKNKVEILAFLNGALVGIAGITPVGRYFKVAHRAVFGISVLKDHWGAGIGSELTKACIECAMMAGYKQIELEVLADNVRAVSLYEKFRFRIIGSNPLGFRFRTGEYCETVYMRLEI